MYRDDWATGRSTFASNLTTLVHSFVRLFFPGFRDNEKKAIFSS